MNTWSPERYRDAWEFATRFHHGQTYGGPNEGEQIEYINHIASVAMEVMWALPTDPALDGDLAIQCALLHDVIEDTKATPELVTERFGDRVTAGVLALTKDKNIRDKSEQMTDSLKRIQLQPKEIWLVKLADRITNLYHPPFYWDKTRILSYQQEARTIYEALHSANAALAKRLQEMIKRYSTFAR